MNIVAEFMMRTMEYLTMAPEQGLGFGSGQKLMKKGQCMGQDTAVDERINKLADEWDYLVNKSKDKSEKLQEANRQAVYNAGLKDIEFWLGEVEHSMSSPDYRKDSASADSFLSKHQVLGTDIQAHEDRIKDLNERADEFIEAGTWDADTIRERKKLINERYEKVKQLAENRAVTLGKAKRLHDFYRTIDDEEAWIRNKKTLVSAEGYGRDLIGVRNLKKKHQRLENEINAHEPVIQNVEKQGHELMKSLLAAGKLKCTCLIFLDKAESAVPWVGRLAIKTSRRRRGRGVDAFAPPNVVKFIRNYTLHDLSREANFGQEDALSDRLDDQQFVEIDKGEKVTISIRRVIECDVRFVGFF